MSHPTQCHTVCLQNNKANYFLAQRHQTATKRSNFWHSNLGDNCESADYLPRHLHNTHTW